jgi:hypothetical protein
MERRLQMKISHFRQNEKNKKEVMGPQEKPER